MGGECGMPYLATTKPVAQMTTNTRGIARTSIGLAVAGMGSCRSDALEIVTP